jgi:Ca2+-binding RTX toxin-like protein
MNEFKDDLVQETITQYSSKLLDKGSQALKAIAGDVRALAGATADRAAHFRSMIGNLDILSASVHQQVSSVEASKLSPETRAFVDAYQRESGKARGFFTSSLQAEKTGAAITIFSKNLGGLVSAIGFVSTVADPKATEFSVGRELGGLGASILAGGMVALATSSVFPVVVAGATGAFAGRFAWDIYANAIGWSEKTSPNFHDTMRSTFNTVRNAFGFKVDEGGNASAPLALSNRLSSDFTDVSIITWPNGTRQNFQTEGVNSAAQVIFRKDGGYTKITHLPDGRVGHHTVDALGAVVRAQSPAPTGITLARNQFYVDASANSLSQIAEITGVSASTLLGLNPTLGVGSDSQPIGVGQVINLPIPTNLLNIEIDANPRPRIGSLSETKAAEDVRNGFVHNSATSKISFPNDILNRTDFASTRMGSLATGGIRPGEFQLDPNAKPGAYLSTRYVDPFSTSNPNAPRLNATVLNGLAAMTTINTYIDPILLDLSGAGVKTTGIEDGVMFDVDHSGTQKRTGWADRTTGILVVDDGSGQITNASQMLSEYYGGKASANGGPGEAPFNDGFGALASGDQTRDGIIDSRDPIWNSLKVWVDSNHDGQSGGELKTLEALGITQISVAPTAHASGETQNGNEIVGRGTFTMNGETRELMAVNFLADPVSNTFTDVEGGTRITSTTSTITRTAYASTNSSNETLDAAILGVDNVYAGRGDTTLIASPLGSWLVGGGGSNTYQGGAGDDVFVISARDNPNDIHGNGGLDTAIIVGDRGVTLNMAKAGLTVAEGGRGDDVIVSGGNSSAFIKGGQGNTTIIGGGGNDVLAGGAGRNTIIGGTGNAVIYAGASGDTIYASAQGSIIHAGAGADRIFGAAGDDAIEAGHGDAHIDGGGGTNLVTLHGEHGDYTITRTETGYTIADRQAGRDGTLTLKNIQKLNFSNISAVDLTLPNPMPVSDSLRVDQAGQAFDHTQPHLIAASQLLENDQPLSSQGPLKIISVGDAIGGNVELTQAGDVLFTPNPTYSGVMSFKYGISDSASNPAAAVVDINSGKTAPMRGTVALSAPNVPVDPLAVQEWYLSDANIVPVWQDYTGKGVRIGQFEPGGDFATEP